MSVSSVTAPPALAPVREAVSDLLDTLAGGGVRDLDHSTLTALVEGVRCEQARLEAGLLVAVAEVDARGSHVHEGALTTAAWLRAHTRATSAEAASTARTARLLATGVLPGTVDALAAGAITPRHAQVIAAGLADAPPAACALVEGEVLEVARAADVRAVASVLRAVEHALDPESSDEAALRRYERRGLSLAPTLDGSMVLSGLADDASAAVIATAVDAASPLHTGDRRTAAQRRLDGLREICQRYLDSPSAPRTAGAAPHVLVVTDAASMAGEPGSPGAVLGWVGQVTASTGQRLACDAAVTTVAIDGRGEVVSTEVARRFFTAAQRRAMVARDGDRCLWPWCDRPVSWSDGHHLVPWSQGGPTTVANAGLPCAGHHTMLHEGGWRAERRTDGRYLVRHRDGRSLGPEPHPPGHHRPPPGDPAPAPPVPRPPADNAPAPHRRL